MLLAIDAGNTKITIGAFEDSKLTRRWRVRTIHEQTADEWDSPKPQHDNSAERVVDIPPNCQSGDRHSAMLALPYLSMSFVFL